MNSTVMGGNQEKNTGETVEADTWRRRIKERN
jgi:hypothetical protein